MPLKTIVVHAAGDAHLDARLAVSTALAQAHGARLLAVFPLAATSTAMLYADAIPVQAIEARIDAERQAAAGLRATVADRLSRKGIAWEWRTMEGPAARVLAVAGAAADVIVMGQAEGDAESSLAITVALTAGRPVLCVPPGGGAPTCGRRILLAWNGTRESARAAHDALPFLQAAEKVVLFCATSDTDDAATSGDAAAHLAAHGAAIELKSVPRGGVDAGAAILDAAAAAGADLIVMGAYGHSRLREWVFGGATRTILGAMTVPTLISH